MTVSLRAAGKMVKCIGNKRYVCGVRNACDPFGMGTTSKKKSVQIGGKCDFFCTAGFLLIPLNMLHFILYGNSAWLNSDRQSNILK